MATVTININGISEGWTGASGAAIDIDEAIASADGNEYGAGAEADAATFDLSAHGLSDSDTITNVSITVRSRDAGTAGTRQLNVDWLIGGSPQGTTQTVTVLGTTSHVTHGAVNDAGWNSDWTAAQLDGAQVRLTPQQSGMPGTNAAYLDCVDVVITYTGTVPQDLDLNDNSAGIASGEVFGTHSVAENAELELSGAAIASGEAFGAHSIAENAELELSGAAIASGEAFGSHSLSESVELELTGAGIASGEAFGTHDIETSAPPTTTFISSTAPNDQKKPRRWNVNPALVAPEWRWFWDAATVVVPFWLGGGEPRDIISRSSCAEQAISGFAWGAGEVGLFKETTIAAGDREWRLPVTADVALPRATHGTILMITRKTDATNRGSFGFFSGIGAEIAESLLPWSDGTTYFDWGGNSVASGQRISSASAPTQGLIKWVFRAGPSGLAFYANGVLQASNTTAASRTVAANSLDVGTNDLKEHYFFACLDAEISEAQVQQWSRDPFGPFRMSDEISITVGGGPAVQSLDLAGAAIASGESFGSHTISENAELELTGAGIASTTAFGSHAISEAQYLDVQGFAETTQFGSPAISETAYLVTEGILSGEAFGLHSISEFAMLDGAGGISSTLAFGSPAISEHNYLVTSGFANSQSFGEHVIEEIVALDFDGAGIASGLAFGQHQMTMHLTHEGGISSAEAFGSHTISEHAYLVCEGIASGVAFGSDHTIDGGVPFVSPEFGKSGTHFGRSVSTSMKVHSSQQKGPGSKSTRGRELRKV